MGFSSPRTGVIAAAALLLALAGASGPAGAEPRSVHPALRGPIDPSLAISERFLSRDAQGVTLLNLIVEGDVPPGLLRARGIEVNTVAGRFMTARCPLGLLNALLSIPGIERVEIAERCEPVLDLSAVDTGVSTVRIVSPPTFSGQTGAGILIGDVDTGIDLTHADFQHPDGTTRLVSVWDQSVTITPPAGFTYGSEWTPAQINSGASTEIDEEGHGTHVLGIAGGDGSATGSGEPAFTYVGVAPEADLCMVKTTFSTTNIVDGVNYIFQKAASLGKQAVVNLSLGSQAGPHDGTYSFDAMINALTGPGRIVTASAGNSQQDNIHAQLTLSGTTPQTMTLNMPTYNKNPGPSNDYVLISAWYAGADNISLTIVSPNGYTVGPVARGTSDTNNNTQDGYINVYNGTTSPSNGDNEIYVEIVDNSANRAPQTGIWEFIFTPVSIAATGRVDGYAYFSALGFRTTHAQWVQGLIAGGVIGTPGSADSVITAGAHTTKACWTSTNGNGYCWSPTPTLGAIASFSSQGPLRDGTIKPDVTAPGFGVSAAKSADYAEDPALIMPDDVHFIQPGTSMSAPHVAGTAALLLAQPAWANSGPSKLKARLMQTARTDGFTGATPNATWGAGKLDAAAALAPLGTLTLLHPSKGQYIPPGKPDSVEVVVGGATADSVALTLSLDGGASFTIPLGSLTNVAPGPPRSLVFFVDASMATTQAKVQGTAFFPGSSSVTAATDSLFLIQAPVGV